MRVEIWHFEKTSIMTTLTDLGKLKLDKLTHKILGHQDHNSSKPGIVP